MGDIIAFRTRPRDARPPTPKPGGAEIFFFLGVRYARIEEAEKSFAEVPDRRDDQSGGGKKRRRRARA
jgi:hypothetical protein